MNIVFYGTPEFSVPSLKAIVEAGYSVKAVVTMPDKPSGRGMSLTPSAIKVAALELGIPILQPEKMKSPDFIDQLKAINPDLQIVIAFRMMPEIVWAFPKMGTFNLHASLLPQYRGAAPINRALMNGETKTGLTTFFLKHEIDTGNIILQKEMEIGPDENAGHLHDRMMIAGAQLVLESLRLIEKGNLNLTPQIESHKLKHAPKIFKSDCLIDWSASAEHIYNQIRGLSPYPSAYTTMSGDILKIFSAKFEGSVKHSHRPGEIVLEKQSMKVACGDGYIIPLEIQPAGKKKITASDYINGLRGQVIPLAGS